MLHVRRTAPGTGPSRLPQKEHAHASVAETSRAALIPVCRVNAVLAAPLLLDRRLERSHEFRRRCHRLLETLGRYRSRSARPRWCDTLWAPGSSLLLRHHPIYELLFLDLTGIEFVAAYPDLSPRSDDIRAAAPREPHPLQVESARAADNLEKFDQANVRNCDVFDSSKKREMPSLSASAARSSHEISARTLSSKRELWLSSMRTTGSSMGGRPRAT